MTDNDTGNVEVSLDEVLITHELARRQARAPDYCAESRALTLLSRELVTHPQGVLQRLAELALQLCRAGTAGVSVLERGADGDVFRWPAVAGVHAEVLGGAIPRHDSPCGIVIERNTTLLFDTPDRHFASLRCGGPPLVECLLVPWMIDDQPVGTVWAVSHDPDRRFDAEDARLLAELSSFAACAHQIVKALDGDRQCVERGFAALRDKIEMRAAGPAAPGAAEATLLANPAILRPLLELHVAAPGQADLPAALAPVLNRACALTGAERGRIDLLAGPDAGRSILAQRAHGTAFGYRNDVVPRGPAVHADMPYALPLPGHDGTALGTLRLALARPPAPDGTGLLDLLVRTAAGAIERHRSHAAQRVDERRQAFLLRLNDVLRPLADPRRIQAEAARVLRDHLGVDRIGYAADCGDGEHLIVTCAHGTTAPAFADKLRYADYGAGLLAALRTGHPVVRPDVATDPRLDAAARAAHAALGVAAVADVPLVKDGRLVAVLFAHHGRARDWTDADLALMQETAERTWAAVERAQAQTESEAAHEALMRQSRFVATTLDGRWMRCPTSSTRSTARTASSTSTARWKNCTAWKPARSWAAASPTWTSRPTWRRAWTTTSAPSSAPASPSRTRCSSRAPRARARTSSSAGVPCWRRTARSSRSWGYRATRRAGACWRRACATARNARPSCCACPTPCARWTMPMRSRRRPRAWWPRTWARAAY